MKLYNRIFIASVAFLIALPAFSQQKKTLSLEDIFERQVFYQQSVQSINWMADGRYYTAMLPDAEEYYEHIVRFDITTGEVVDTLVNGADLVPDDEPYALAYNDYQLSSREDKLLFATELEPIYRRSSKAYYYVYDTRDKSFRPIDDAGKQSYATFSPDGSKVAFVRDNNLFYVTLDDMEVHQITTDGKFNHLIHGNADWVYEEEFGFAQAFYWSPEGDKLAYLSFNEAAVNEYNMQLWSELYPADYRFKYPKAGEANSEISLSVYHLDEDKTVKMEVGEDYEYIPRVKWTTDNNMLSFIRMNRLQNRMELLFADATTGKTELVMKEEAKTYVDVESNDQLIFLPDGRHFLTTSESSGYRHIYLYRTDGSLVRQITDGAWEVTELTTYDPERELIYFTSTEESPLQRHLYSIKLNGKRKKKLTEGPGTYEANFSPDHRYYVLYHSSVDSPLTVSLHEAPSARQISVLEDNQLLKEELQTYELGNKEFFTFRTPEDTLLYGYMIKPADFDPNKKYPVLMYVYGGPGSQQVRDSWQSSRDYWFHYLAQEGYIVACIDNRGTGGRGRDFKHITYGQLGKYEVQDQIAGAKYLGGLPYVDADRIGIWGWSYGGYMASLALFIGNDVFTAGIAVAPVSNWRFYDTIYTERYLQTPQLNAAGYDAFSPLTHAAKLEGDFLLVHGTGDDNVHFQNAIALQDALIAAGKQFDSFFYPNRNHGIYGGNTRLHLFEMITDFVKEKI
ncbi:MAG: S9 family peptidase [Cyclobacteriaceae bacterium]